MSRQHNAIPNNVVLKVGHRDVLVDDVIRVRVLGLAPRAEITIYNILKEKGRTFVSSACFNADNLGVVDASQYPSVLGTYTGVHPMGLFWSMVPAPGEPLGTRLFKRDASTPLVTNISVYSGHRQCEDIYSSNEKPLVSKTVNRWYMDKGVRRINVKHGRIRGSVFIPKGKGPFPGVIDMFGVAGSLAEFRAALLASRGFVAYALPYFAYDDLPISLEDMDVEYFVEAADWLASQPFVGGNSIGVIGVSKGGEIALHLAYYSPKVKAVASINGAAFFTSSPMTYGGEYIGISGIDLSKMIITQEGRVYRDVYDEETNLPLHEKDVHVLLLVSEDDMALNPRYLKEFYESYPVGRRHLIELYSYPGAGHLLEPPYSPMARSTTRVIRGWQNIDGVETVVWGGSTVAHAKAQEHSWSKILQFFTDTLQTGTATACRL